MRIVAKEPGRVGFGGTPAAWLPRIAIGTIIALAIACGGDNGNPTPAPTGATGGPTTTAGTSTPAADAPTGGTWRTLAPMPTPRTEVAVATLGGKIYVIGGFEGDGAPSAKVEVYDPATDTWSAAAPLPERRHSVYSAI